MIKFKNNKKFINIFSCDFRGNRLYSHNFNVIK